MSNSNKEVSIIKDDKIEFRINKKEKKIFTEAAKKKHMTLSEFVITTLRGEILKDDLLSSFAPGAALQSPEILRKLEHLEQLIQKNHSENLNALQDINPEHKEDLLMKYAQDQIFWMLQKKEFQKPSHKELLELLRKNEPDLKPYLEESPQRLFTALDLALEKLIAAGIIEISRKGIIHWKK